MPAKSLVALAQREAIKNIGHIDNLGYAPYSLVRPILFKVPRAEQLLRIEENSPHLAEDTAEVWKYMIKRDFSRASEKKGYVPKNPLSWGKVYLKYQRERDEENAAAEALLRNEMNALRQERASKETRVLRPGEVPYEFRKATAVGAFGRFGAAGPARTQSNLTWGGGARTKNVMKKVKREVAELNRRNVISGQLAARRGQISQAPKTMLNDQRISRNPDLPADKSVIAPRPPGSILAKGRSDMESRLLRAKQQAADKGRSGGSGARTGDSSRPSKPPPPKRPQVELADDDLEMDDDALFGITEPAAAKPSKAASVPSKKPQPPVRRGISPGFLDDESYEDDEDLFGEKAESAVSKRPASRAPPPRAAAGSPPAASRKRPGGGDIFMRSGKKQAR
ncbi:hypothetical protein RB595_007565 [Gaeumannomyces hyphopodioides]